MPQIIYEQSHADIVRNKPADLNKSRPSITSSKVPAVLGSGQNYKVNKHCWGKQFRAVFSACVSR